MGIVDIFRQMPILYPHGRWSSSHMEASWSTLQRCIMNMIVTIGRKDGNVLFSDALSTFLFTVMWRQTYGT